ncbi:MAG: L,D-transpeptidase [Verrucomicrobiota bacterium]
MADTVFERMRARLKILGIKPSPHLLVANLARQELRHLDGARERVYRMSSSARPPSCVADSLGTPTGLHAIADKIGAGEPEGTVFRGRVPVASHWRDLPPAEQQRNCITSRILRLRGLEPRHNAGESRDSYARYIYIHGTNHEERLGQPFSSGCLELSNADVRELFEAVPEGSLLWIIED